MWRGLHIARPSNILGPRLRGDDVLLQPTWPNNPVGFVRLPL